MHVAIRPERPQDHDAIAEVNRRAFAGDGEARLVDQLRAEGYVRLSLVAEINGRVAGHLLFSKLKILTPEGMLPALALAPLAVLPELQRQGIGSALMWQGLEDCRQAGHRIVIVLGHPAYYPKFGFSAKLAKPLDSPYVGDAFMALELVGGALDGVRGRVEYAAPFAQF